MDTLWCQRDAASAVLNCCLHRAVARGSADGEGGACNQGREAEKLVGTGLSRRSRKAEPKHNRNRSLGRREVRLQVDDVADYLFRVVCHELLPWR